MRLLDRYLFHELLTPLAFCLVGFLIFWVSADAFNSLADFQEEKLHLLDILEYYLMMTPEFLVAILPIVLLLALLYTLTNHARHNEITAMRAAGVSLWRVCMPYLVVGLAASAALFVLNEWCAPRGADGADRIKHRYVQKPGDAGRPNGVHLSGFNNTRAHRAWVFSEYHAKSAEMLNPQVNWTSPEGLNCQLSAKRAMHTNGAWMFFEVGLKAIAPANAQNAQIVSSLQTNELVMAEFNETPAEIQSQLKINAYENQRSARRADIPLMDIWRYLRLRPDLSPVDSSYLYTKLQGRLAAPWTCLVVVLIAIPFGAASGRRNLFVGVAGSIFICFAFFVIQQTGLALGSGGHLPAWLAAWLPNLLFGVTGLVLTARVR